MESELTLGDIYDGIADRLALARTKALMGERQEALGLFQGASLDYTRFRDVLSGYPGFHALEHAFQHTLAQLCGEQEEGEHWERGVIPGKSEARPRRKSRKAA